MSICTATYIHVESVYRTKTTTATVIIIIMNNEQIGSHLYKITLKTAIRNVFDVGVVITVKQCIKIRTPSHILTSPNRGRWPEILTPSDILASPNRGRLPEILTPSDILTSPNRGSVA